MTELEGLILFWQSLLAFTGHFLEPSVQAHINNTIKHLEFLKKLQETEEWTTRY